MVQPGGGGAVCAPTAAGYAAIEAYPGLSQTNLSVFQKYVQPGTLARRRLQTAYLA